MNKGLHLATGDVVGINVLMSRMPFIKKFGI